MSRSIYTRLPQAPLTRRVYTADETSEILRVSRPSVYNMMKAGTLPYITVSGRRRILVETIERLLAAGE